MYKYLYFLGNTITSTINDQALTSSNNTIDHVKLNAMTEKFQKQQNKNTNNFNNNITKLSMLAVSGQSVHTLSYNCHNDNDQSIAIHRLSRWLEMRRTAFTTSIYHMLGLQMPKLRKKGQPNSTRDPSHSSKTNMNLDLLLDYKSYVSAVGEHDPVKHNKVTIEKNSKIPNNRTKPIDNNDTDDKKTKSTQFKKDVHDSFIERLVRNGKQQRRIGEINHNTFLPFQI